MELFGNLNHKSGNLSKLFKDFKMNEKDCILIYDAKK